MTTPPSTIISTAAFLTKYTRSWREASTIIISVWRADHGSYFTVQGRDEQGLDLWSVPNLEYSEGSAADLVADLETAKPLPASSLSSDYSTAEHWGSDQISGGLHQCVEVWIKGGPWLDD